MTDRISRLVRHVLTQHKYSSSFHLSVILCVLFVCDAADSGYEYNSHHARSASPSDAHVPLTPYSVIAIFLCIWECSRRPGEQSAAWRLWTPGSALSYHWIINQWLWCMPSILFWFHFAVISDHHHRHHHHHHHHRHHHQLCLHREECEHEATADTATVETKALLRIFYHHVHGKHALPYAGPVACNQLPRHVRSEQNFICWSQLSEHSDSDKHLRF